MAAPAVEHFVLGRRRGRFPGRGRSPPGQMREVNILIIVGRLFGPDGWKRRSPYGIAGRYPGKGAPAAFRVLSQL